MTALVLLLLVFLVFAVFSKRLEHSSITGPIVFTAVGLAASVNILGRMGVEDVISLHLDSSIIQGLLTGTLVIVLFTDATRIDIRSILSKAALPGRLLGVGLPLTIVFGTVTALVVFPNMGFWSAAVIAIILAPTDAALGQAVVSNDEVPDLIRQGVAVESGLNDGMVVPFLTVALAGAANELQTGTGIAAVFFEEILFAVAAGVVVGWIGARVVTYASDRDWMSVAWRQVSVGLLALVCFAVADSLGGSGFIAAFVGGLFFGKGTRERFPEVSHFAEGIGHLATMIAFFVFGSLILGPAIDLVTWRVVLYAVLSLTFVRMVPVLIALIGNPLRLPSRLYVAWFGPRGLASLVFIGTVLVEAEPSGAQVVFVVGAVTVGLSVLLHGVTAWPLSVRYGIWYRRVEEAVPAPALAESTAVDHVPTRRSIDRLRRSE